MGNKLGDFLEDEVNQGLTINTYNKRINLVSNQPQTFYHNSGASLYNFKYTDDGNTTAGQARYGQIQLAPSNTTNLNPALTLISSRVNGLGNVGSIFLDSTYGVAPLILSPQSLTDAGGNQFSMVRSTVSLPAGSLRNTFSSATGYTAGVSISNDLQFATKQYVDSAISGVPQPDLTPYVKKDGTIAMTGALNMGTNKITNLADGINDSEAVNRK